MKPVLSILAACALGALVAGCGGGSSSSSSTTTTTTASSAPAAAGASTSDGAKIYDTNCSSCHGAAGAGAKGMFPPLAGNATVTGDPMAVVHIVRNGLTGTIEVNGSTYNGQMPAWKAQLSNADIAAVITHIRTSWGNKASAVTEAQVDADK